MTLEEAAAHWAATLNEWYNLGATTEEVIDAFNKNYLDKEAYDGTSYVDMFFRNDRGEYWRDIDTADREGLADCIERARVERRKQASAAEVQSNHLQGMHSIEWQIDVITAAIVRLEEALGKEDSRWRDREPFYKIIQNPKNSMYSVYNKLGALSDEEIRMIQNLRETA